ncbi:TPA: hypothetical protein ACGO7F_000897 [Streptococcus suis]
MRESGPPIDSRKIKDTVVETENETVDISKIAVTTEKTFTQEEVKELIEKCLAKQEKPFYKCSQVI